MVAWPGASGDLPLEDACLDCLFRLAYTTNHRKGGSGKFARAVPMEKLLRIVDAWLLQATRGNYHPLLCAHLCLLLMRPYNDSLHARIVVVGAAEGQTVNLDTLARVFVLVKGALSRARHNGAGTDDLLTGLWPGLMPHVLLVVCKLARALQHVEVRCCTALPSSKHQAAHIMSLQAQRRLLLEGSCCQIVPCPEQ